MSDNRWDADRIADLREQLAGGDDDGWSADLHPSEVLSLLDELERATRERGGYDARWHDFYGGEYTGEAEVECLTMASDEGWWISRRHKLTGLRAVLCPYHAREVPR